MKNFSQKYCVYKKNAISLHPLNETTAFNLLIGEVAEWSIAPVLKTDVLKGTGGSNPSLSAAKGVNQVVTRFTPFFTPKNQGWVYFLGLNVKF